MSIRLTFQSLVYMSPWGRYSLLFHANLLLYLKENKSLCLGSESQTQGKGGAFSHEANDGQSVLAALHMQNTLGGRLANHLFQLTFIHFRENKTNSSEIKIGIYVINYEYRISVFVLYYAESQPLLFPVLQRSHKYANVKRHSLFFCSFLNNMLHFVQICQFIFLFDLC